MWDGFNTRKFPRVSLDCQITLQPESFKNPIPVKTENIGVGGVCIIQNQSLERFSKCRLRLELGKESQPIECNGKIVWIIPRKEISAKEKIFDTGIEFTDLAPAQKERIQSFINENVPKGFEEII